MGIASKVCQKIPRGYSRKRENVKVLTNSGEQRGQDQKEYDIYSCLSRPCVVKLTWLSKNIKVCTINLLNSWPLTSKNRNEKLNNSKG